jgi:hypothetical protein
MTASKLALRPMPRKKSVKLAAQRFIKATEEVLDFFQKTAGLKEEFHSWCTDYSVIRLYQEFEAMMLSALTGAINNDTTTLSQSVGLDFPKHLSEDVCTYLIVGTGYFDFKGRDGLIQIIKSYVPDSHYLVAIIKDPAYKDTLERLSALRNFSAHESKKAKKAAVKAIGGEKLGSAGSWLKRQDRFLNLCSSLKALAHDVEKKVPY